jgi:hypothetical protein
MLSSDRIALDGSNRDSTMSEESRGSPGSLDLAQIDDPFETNDDVRRAQPLSFSSDRFRAARLIAIRKENLSNGASSRCDSEFARNRMSSTRRFYTEACKSPRSDSSREQRIILVSAGANAYSLSFVARTLRIDLHGERAHINSLKSSNRGEGGPCSSRPSRLLTESGLTIFRCPPLRSVIPGDEEQIKEK